MNIKKEHIFFARGKSGEGNDYSLKELESLKVALLFDIATSLECLAAKHNEEIYKAGYEEGMIDGQDLQF